MDQVQVRELLGEVVEAHPELSLVPDPDTEQLLVPVTEGVPLPAPLRPGPVPLAPAPGVPQPDLHTSDVSTRVTSWVTTDQVSVPQLAPHPRQPRHAVGVSGHQPIAEPGLPLV